ncbi:hypothetical protein A2U01_0112318 [Trifolium medium]|uniref:Uncharacterized protein n=1 Tax=Trifolium medium TaxID=97028 RepID=A0A392VRL2_9FABA|nr:hypothetical protein [Trifolium medium]
MVGRRHESHRVAWAGQDGIAWADIQRLRDGMGRPTPSICRAGR